MARNVDRLFVDYRKVAVDYDCDTKKFRIAHIIGIRKTIAQGHTQGLSARKVGPEELFVASSLELSRI